MKTLLFGLLLITSTASMASDFCMAVSEVVSYSRISYRLYCNNNLVGSVRASERYRIDEMMEMRGHKLISTHMIANGVPRIMIYANEDSKYMHASKTCISVNYRKDGLTGWLTGNPTEYQIDCGSENYKLLENPQKSELTNYYTRRSLKKVHSFGQMRWFITTPWNKRQIDIYQTNNSSKLVSYIESNNKRK